MPKPQGATIAAIKEFARKNPAQWEKLKLFMRTSERPRGLRLRTVADFTKLGLDHYESIDNKRKNPYRAAMSPEERREIRRQVTDLVNLIHPRKSTLAKKRQIDKLIRSMRPVTRQDVESRLAGRDFSKIFDVGRMYLSAINPHNEPWAKRRKLRLPLTIGYVYGSDLVLGRGWMKSAYTRTTPFHEAAHRLIPRDSEYKVHLAEYYYSLKRGIMAEKYLLRKRRFEPWLKNARQRAIELFHIGQKEGWDRAEKLLRAELRSG